MLCKSGGPSSEEPGPTNSRTRPTQQCCPSGAIGSPAGLWPALRHNRVQGPYVAVKSTVLHFATDRVSLQTVDHRVGRDVSHSHSTRIWMALFSRCVLALFWSNFAKLLKVIDPDSPVRNSRRPA